MFGICDQGVYKTSKGAEGHEWSLQCRSEYIRGTDVSI